MRSWYAIRRPICGCGGAVIFLLFHVAGAQAQGPAPETAPPLFPGGALVSYNSMLTSRAAVSIAVTGIPATARPTFTHEGNFNFTWGFHRDFDLTVLLPLVTNHFLSSGPAGTPAVGGMGLGDLMVLMKYRFYRRDSERGTAQTAVTLGPKIPTGRTNLVDTSGNRLPAGLQAGSGSTDFFLAVNWTYTGLFHIKRLVADEDFHALLRTQGTQATRLGTEVESRFWLSYRPFQSKTLAHEWFIGPTVTWSHWQDDRIAGVKQAGSGGDALLFGATTYVGLRPGMHVWLGMDWDVAHTRGGSFMPLRRRISFGITQQFRLHQ